MVALSLLQYTKMKRASADSTSAKLPKPAGAAGKRPTPLLLDMADTTWRMFIPTIGLLMLGRHFDVRFATKPWLMLLGAAIGGAIAWLLVKQQLSVKRGK